MSDSTEKTTKTPRHEENLKNKLKIVRQSEIESKFSWTETQKALASLCLGGENSLFSGKSVIDYNLIGPSYQQDRHNDE